MRVRSWAEQRSAERAANRPRNGEMKRFCQEFTAARCMRGGDRDDIVALLRFQGLVGRTISALIVPRRTPALPLCRKDDLRAERMVFGERGSLKITFRSPYHAYPLHKALCVVIGGRCPTRDGRNAAAVKPVSQHCRCGFGRIALPPAIIGEPPGSLRARAERMAGAIEKPQSSEAYHGVVRLSFYRPQAEAVRIKISVVSRQIEQGVGGCHRTGCDPPHHLGICIDCCSRRYVGLSPTAQDQTLGFQSNQ